MDFLKIFLAALGGTGTALLLIGFFGKTIIEHWFKQDFARFQASLDAIASKDETRFNYHFTNTADAFKEIAKRASETSALAAKVLFQKTTPLHSRTAESDKLLNDNSQVLREQVNAMAMYSSSVRYLLDSDTNGLLTNFYGSMAVVMATSPEINGQLRNAWDDNIRASFKKLEDAFRQFIVNEDKNKKSP